MFKFTNISLALLRHGNLIKRRKLLEFDYKSTTFRKVRVAFNNVYRRVLGLPKWSSASEYMPFIILKILKQSCEKLYMDLYNGLKTAVM